METCFVVHFLLNFFLDLFETLLMSSHLVFEINNFNHFVHTRSNPLFDLFNINLKLLLSHFGGISFFGINTLLLRPEYFDFLTTSFVEYFLSLRLLFKLINLFILLHVSLFHSQNLVSFLFSEFVVALCFFLPFSLSTDFLSLNLRDFTLKTFDLIALCIDLPLDGVLLLILLFDIF